MKDFFLSIFDFLECLPATQNCKVCLIDSQKVSLNDIKENPSFSSRVSALTPMTVRFLEG
jgi:hypothetical protein